MTLLRFPLSSTLLVGASLLLFSACKGGPVADHVEIAPPPVDADAPQHLPGLHNVVTYDEDIVCGGVPEGEEGLRTLRAMGIKTIVSVDGTKPNAAAAEQLGMRYIHLPISYDTVEPERQKELAQALANTEHPIYMHCHHGKHRSAAALGSAVVMAGVMTPEQACDRMAISGTSPKYKGLWAAVRGAKPLAKQELVADPASFPSVSEVSGMVEIMAEVDLVLDFVKQAKDAGWKAPEDHPDLIATKETRRLATLMARLQEDRESQGYEAKYQGMLQETIDLTQRLDEAARGGRLEMAAGLVDAVEKSCKACHADYRNN